MKLIRTSLLLLLGFSLSAPSAFACGPSSAALFTWVYRMMHPEPDSFHENSRHNYGRHGTTTTTPTAPPTSIPGPKGT